MAASCKKGYQANLPCPQITVITNELCIFITRDALLWKDLGWEIFVRERQGWGYFKDLRGVEHLDHCLLKQ